MANCVTLSGSQNKEKDMNVRKRLREGGGRCGRKKRGVVGGKINHNALCICMKFLNNKFNLKSIVFGFGEVSR